MSALNTITANLSIQNTDASPANTGTLWSRIFPALTYGSTLWTIYSGYQVVRVGALVDIFAVLVSPQVPVALIRNAGPAPLEIKYSNAQQTNGLFFIGPGGLWLYFNGIGATGDANIFLTDLQIAIDSNVSGTTSSVEWIYAQ